MVWHWYTNETLSSGNVAGSASMITKQQFRLYQEKKWDNSLWTIWNIIEKKKVFWGLFNDSHPFSKKNRELKMRHFFLWKNQEGFAFFLPLHDFCRESIFRYTFFFPKICLNLPWKSILRLEPGSKDPRKKLLGRHNFHY